MQKVAVVVQEERAVRARRRCARCGPSPTTPRTTTRSSTSSSRRPGPGGSRARPASTSTSSTGWTRRRTPTWCAWCPSAATATRRRRSPSCAYRHARGAYLRPLHGRLHAGRGRTARRPSRTTHWRHVEELAARFPRRDVRPDVLYVQDGSIVTGAGSAAGLDAALHLMRQQFGAGSRPTAARRMVVPPHRDGGQAQYIARAGAGLRVRGAGPPARRGSGATSARTSAWTAGPADPHVVAHLRPPLQGGDRHHALQLDPRGAGARRAGAARADRPLHGVGRRRGGLRQRRHPAPPLRPRAGVSPQEYRRTFARPA